MPSRTLYKGEYRPNDLRRQSPLNLWWSANSIHGNLWHRVRMHNLKGIRNDVFVKLEGGPDLYRIVRR